MPFNASVNKSSSLQRALSELSNSLALLKTRRFGTFWFASFLSNIGTWAQQVAEPWLLLSLGAAPFLLGLDSFALNAPVWILTLVGGFLADRLDRRRVIAIFQSIQMLCPALIVTLLLFGSIQPYMIITISLIVGVTDALSMPSFQSITPTIVERTEIARGLALNSTQFNLSRILGPAIAGVLMSSVGAVACFALNALSYIPFIGVALWILPRGAQARADEAENRQINPFSGLREILAAPHLRGALATVFTTSLLCGPLIVFCPVLVSETFHGDSGEFSLAIGAFGIGGLLGALGLLAVSPQRDRRRLSSGFAILYGCVIACIALLPWFWGLPALLVLAGAAMTTSNTSANSLLQATAPPHLLGQSVSLFMLATRGGLPLGSLLTGISIETLGLQPALLINGILAVAAQTAICKLGSRSPTPPIATTDDR